ncbi:MAG: citryl-CoA lyase [Rhizobiaceae bacterium]|nr:citryl-CoA lyase [Rhizobiaceae bacterium]
MNSPAREHISTDIATLNEEKITVRGLDVARDMMGKMDAGQLFYFLVVGRRPDPKQSTLINAMIVSVAEHGMMPSTIAARLTLLGAPESFQGAVASGLLGVGDVFVGTTSNVARLLKIEAAEIEGDDEQRARVIVERYLGTKRRIPGLGHPHHPVDPRAERLFALQEEIGAPTDYARLMRAIHSEACRYRGSHITLNGSAAIGSVALDIGIDWRAVRGIGVVARSIGLVGHILEELNQPAATDIWKMVEDKTIYTGPASD